jgi:hypothetical protein
MATTFWDNIYWIASRLFFLWPDTSIELQGLVQSIQSSVQMSVHETDCSVSERWTWRPILVIVAEVGSLMPSIESSKKHLPIYPSGKRRRNSAGFDVSWTDRQKADGTQPAEVRNASNNMIRRYFAQGN